MIQNRRISCSPAESPDDVWLGSPLEHQDEHPQIAELQASSNPIREVAGRLLGFEASDPSNGAKVLYNCIGDAGTLCVLVAPELYDIVRWPVQLVLAAGPARGQTLVDRRAIPGEDSVHDVAGDVPVIEVVGAARNAQILALFFDTLGEA